MPSNVVVKALLLLSQTTISTYATLTIPPQRPPSYPSADQTVLISGAFLTAPLVVEAIAHIRDNVSPALLAIPPANYNSSNPASPSYVEAGKVPNCYWPSGQCVRAADTKDFKADIVSCPTANDFGITFDDGPFLDPTNVAGTPQLLASLASANIKATFFMIGSNIQKNPSMAVDAFKAGHQLAIHTWSHHPMTALTNEQIVAEIKYSESIMYETTGVIPLYFRPPYGDIDDRVRAIISALGYRCIMWTTSPPRDSTDTGAVRNAQVVLATVKSWFVPQAGFIALNHDNSVFTAGISTAMVVALKAFGSSLPINPKPIGTCMGLRDDEWNSYPKAASPSGKSSLAADSRLGWVKVLLAAAALAYCNIIFY